MLYKKYFEKIINVSSIPTSYNICNPNLHSFKYTYISLERSCKAPVKKGLMRNILFKSNQRLKLYIILCILHVLIILIYQTMHYFLYKCEPLPTKFFKGFLCNSEDNIQLLSLMCILIFNVYM